MPSSTPGKSRQSSRHSEEQPDQPASAKTPLWKHQPALLGMFLVECKSYLPGLDSRYRSMITRRTHVLRGKTCVDGKAHMMCHRDGLLDNLWNWETPAPANIEATCAQILDDFNEAARVAAHAAAGTDPANDADPGTYTPPYTPPYANHALTPEERDSYHVGRSANDDLDYELGLTFVSHMANQTKAVAMLSAAGDSFVSLLDHLQRLSAKLAPKTASALVRLRKEHLEAGLDDISITTFETFDETYAQLNACQKGSRRHDDEAVAYNLADAVRDLGDHVAMKIDVKLEVAGAAGDLDKTRECITEVLGEFDSENVGRGRGAAHNAAGRRTDPSKNSKNQFSSPRAEVPFQWADGMRPCRHCGGSHLDSRCDASESDKAEHAKKVELKRSDRKEKRKRGKSKLSSGLSRDPESSDDDDSERSWSSDDEDTFDDMPGELLQALGSEFFSGSKRETVAEIESPPDGNVKMAAGRRAPTSTPLEEARAAASELQRRLDIAETALRERKGVTAAPSAPDQPKIEVNPNALAWPPGVTIASELSRLGLGPWYLEAAIPDDAPIFVCMAYSAPPGIYIGSWDAPDLVRRHVDKHSAVGRPGCKRAKSLYDAVQLCAMFTESGRSQGLPPILPILRGPLFPEGLDLHTDLRSGFVARADVLTSMLPTVIDESSDSESDSPDDLPLPPLDSLPSAPPSRWWSPPTAATPDAALATVRATAGATDVRTLSLALESVSRDIDAATQRSVQSSLAGTADYCAPDSLQSLREERDAIRARLADAAASPAPQPTCGVAPERVGPFVIPGLVDPVTTVRAASASVPAPAEPTVDTPVTTPSAPPPPTRDLLTLALVFVQTLVVCAAVIAYSLRDAGKLSLRLVTYVTQRTVSDVRFVILAFASQGRRTTTPSQQRRGGPGPSQPANMANRRSRRPKLRSVASHSRYGNSFREIGRLRQSVRELAPPWAVAVILCRVALAFYFDFGCARLRLPTSSCTWHRLPPMRTAKWRDLLRYLRFARAPARPRHAAMLVAAIARSLSRDPHLTVWGGVCFIIAYASYAVGYHFLSQHRSMALACPSPHIRAAIRTLSGCIGAHFSALVRRFLASRDHRFDFASSRTPALWAHRRHWSQLFHIALQPPHPVRKAASRTYSQLPPDARHPHMSTRPQRSTSHTPTRSRRYTPTIPNANCGTPQSRRRRGSCLTTRGSCVGARSCSNPCKTGASRLARRKSPSSSFFHHVKITVDSGSTWHVHPHESDLVNLRPVRESITGIDNKPIKVSKVGDLPIVVLDAKGRKRCIVIRNVRLVPKLETTLISIEQLWRELKLDAVFRDKKYFVAYKGDDPNLGPRIVIPFHHVKDNYYLFGASFVNRADATSVRCAIVNAKPGNRRDPHDSRACGQEASSRHARKSLAVKGIHRAGSKSQFARLPAHVVAAHLHRRLHVGSDAIRRLPKLAADLPDRLIGDASVDCPHCVEANATRVPHSESRYEPTYPGRLVHADIVGPFKLSVRGHRRYALILVDDHSRFKFVYTLQSKSQALKRMRTFVAEFNAHANANKQQPMRVVGSLRTDNAGEFLSREFGELLDDKLIDLTTCPPHVHALNGVAERAIRSICELARAHMVASQCPIGFWPQAMDHAVDILNRTSGPPGSDISSYESLTGKAPRVLGILPFGCQAFAVKPRAEYRKELWESRATPGINLGRSQLSPSAYLIWDPKAGRIISTSEVYFRESFFPWRPSGDRFVGDELPTSPPDERPDQPVGVPRAGSLSPDPEDEPRPPIADSLAGAYQNATRGASPRALPRKVLILFSGPKRRPDGIAAFLAQRGVESVLVDSDAHDGGGDADDLLRSDTYAELLLRVQHGEFGGVFAAPPCSTFSVSRNFVARDTADGGPPPVRSRSEPAGLSSPHPKHARELRRANTLVQRCVHLLRAAHDIGAEFMLEHPADRGDPEDSELFLHHDHAPIWLFPDLIELEQRTGAGKVTFSQCRFGGDYQKHTTFLHSAGLEHLLRPVDRLLCNHDAHRKKAGGEKNDGVWNSAPAAAYPSDLNLFIANAFAIHMGVGQQHHRGGDSVRPDAVHPTTMGNVSRVPDRDDSPENLSREEPGAAPTLGPRTPRSLPASSARSPQSTVRSSPLTAQSLPTRSLRFDEEAVAPRLPVVLEESSPPPSHAGLPPALASSEDDWHLPIGPVLAPRRVGSKAAAANRFPHRAPSLLACGEGRFLLLHSRKDGRLKLVTPRRRRGRMFASVGEPSPPSLAPDGADPRNRRQAMAEDPEGWYAAEVAEIDNHRGNQSWTDLPPSALPRGRKLVKLVWVYKRKRSGKLKARLCVQGCAQVPGVDYDQTWCGTMRSSTLRVLSAIAAGEGLSMRRWDFVAAYLQGELLDDEVVYCYPPPGHERDAHGNARICRVEKPVYGMAQAGRRWQRSIFPWFIEQGFTQSQEDSAVFFKRAQTQTPSGPRDECLFIGCYVDDLYTLASHTDATSLYAKFVEALQAQWKVEDEGEVKDLLNVEISREGDEVVLRQRGYIDKLVAHHLDGGILPERAPKTPCNQDLVTQVEAAADIDPASVDPVLLKQYQSIVGALMYCSTNTRPDITYATGMLCRVMSRPTPELLASARRVVAYLGHTRDIGLHYAASGTGLKGLSDANWATKHSTTGYTFLFRSAAVSWASKKQKSIALSSCEAEIMAASDAAKEAVYMDRFVTELGFGSGRPVELAVDNTAARDLAYNPQHHDRSKHIDRRHFFIREMVEDGRLVVPFVRTSDNLADFFTKPLAPDLFTRFRAEIMNLPRVDGVVARSAGLQHGGVLNGLDYDAPAPAGCHWVDYAKYDDYARYNSTVVIRDSE